MAFSHNGRTGAFLSPSAQATGRGILTSTAGRGLFLHGQGRAEHTTARKSTPKKRCYLGVSDIVKYSRDRLEKIPASASPNHPILEIRTLGSSGLEYRLKTKGQPRSSWLFMPAFPVIALKD